MVGSGFVRRRTYSWNSGSIPLSLDADTAGGLYHPSIFRDFFLEHALRSGRHAGPCATFPESQHSDRRRQGIEGLSGFHRARISLSKPDDILHRIVEPVAVVRRSGGSERHGVVICRSYFVRRRIFASGAGPRECNGTVCHEWQQHATGIAA